MSSENEKRKIKGGAVESENEKRKLKRGAVEPIPHISGSETKKQKIPTEKTNSRIHNRSLEGQEAQHKNRKLRMVYGIINRKFKDIPSHSIPDFDFQLHLSSINHQNEKVIEGYKKTWSERTDLLILNEDMIVKGGDDALVCLLKGLNIDRNKELSDKIVDFANTYRPKDSNFREVRYRSDTTSLPPTQRTSNITYFLHTGTVGLGNEDRTPAASATMVGSVKAVNANVQLLWDLEFISHLNNAALKYLDPVSFNAYSEMRNSKHVSPSTKLFCTQCPSVWLGKAILINEHTKWHRDVKDKEDGWCCIVYFGNFSNGDLFLPDLKMRLHIEAGDVVFLRSYAFVHFVDEWIGEGRFVIVYYTSGNVFTAHRLGEEAEVV